jgi:hypothetical protein
MKTSIWLVCLFVIAHLASGVAIAQVPSTISYQGILTDSEGQLVEDGSYNMHFRLYSGSGTQTVIWEESRSVTVQNGLFSVLLGTNNPLDLPFDQPYYLGLAVGEAPELSPRTALTSSAYSFRARSVDDGQVVTSLNGLRDNINLVAGDNIGLTQNDSTIVISALINAGEGTITGITAGEGLTGGGTAGVVTLAVAEGGVTSSMLADSAVTAHKLVPGSVTEPALADSSVTATKIHPGIDITTTGTVQAGSFIGDGSGLTGLPAGEFSLPFTGEVNGEPAAFSVTNTSEASGITSGVYGESRSTSGRGVFGQASASNGVTYGVYGTSFSIDGRGVYGSAIAANGFNHGVYGETQSTGGRGVSGVANATTGTTSGVYGQSDFQRLAGGFMARCPPGGLTFDLADPIQWHGRCQ